jgi:CRP-like cAMP-binding protein
VNALVRKLANYLDLTETERRTLLDATPETARFPARGDIIHQGDRPHVVNLLLTGLAYRYKMLEDGRRQVLAVFVPGDFCDMRNFILERMDHSIGALTEVTVSQLRPDAFETLIDTSSRLRDAFWWAKLVDDAITREWIVNIGQRTAMERTGALSLRAVLAAPIGRADSRAGLRVPVHPDRAGRHAGSVSRAREPDASGVTAGGPDRPARSGAGHPRPRPAAIRCGVRPRLSAPSPACAGQPLAAARQPPRLTASDGRYSSSGYVGRLTYVSAGWSDTTA